MAEGGFDDFEMEDLGRNYPEYYDMNDLKLGNEYEGLVRTRYSLLNVPNAKEVRVKDVRDRITYIDRIKENRLSETTFTDNNDGKTVTIKRKGDPSTSVLAPELDIEAELPNLFESAANEKIFNVEDFIRRNYDKGFVLDVLHNEKAIELIRNVDKTKNNITFKPLTSRNNRGKPQIILKRDSNGVYTVQ